MGEKFRNRILVFSQHREIRLFPENMRFRSTARSGGIETSGFEPWVRKVNVRPVGTFSTIFRKNNIFISEIQPIEIYVSVKFKAENTRFLRLFYRIQLS